MEEHIIASGSDLQQYIKASNRTYNCKVSRGIGLKKNAYIEFNPIQCQNVFISIRKISGNGKFVLRCNNDSQNKTVFNLEKVFISNPSNIRIERPADAVGDISILFIGCTFEDNMNSLLKELSKCRYGNIRVINNKIIANASAFISDFKQTDKIETIPEKCYTIEGNRITFAAQCIITNLKINNSGVVPIETVEQAIKKDIDQTQLMTMLDSSKQDPVVKEEKPSVPKFVEPKTFARKTIYSSNDSKFANIMRKFGGYKLLNNNNTNNKILSVYAGSEVQMPITTSGSSYYCIETTVRSGTRSFFQLYVGIDNGIIQKTEIKCNTKLSTNKFYLNLDTPNKLCKLIVGVNRKQKDFANIHDLKIFEITVDEYLENIQLPSVALTKNVASQENMQNSIDLQHVLNTIRLNIPDEEKLLPISMSSQSNYKDISIDFGSLDNKINKYDKFVLCVGNVWVLRDFDLFSLMAEAYNIGVVRIPHYGYNKNHFAYAATKAQNIICDSNLVQEVTTLLSAHELIADNSVLQRVANSNVTFTETLDKVITTKFVKPKYTFDEFTGNDKSISNIEVKETNSEIVENYSEDDVRFKIVIPCYNNSKWISKTLESIVSQTYKKYDVCVVDDCSSEQEGRDIIEKYCKENNSTFNKWQYIFNKKRKNSLYNIVNGTKAMNCEDADVIVNIDGDDWLVDEHVLNKVNTVYKNQNVYLTHGQYIYHPAGGKGHCKEIPERVKRTNGYRAYEWNLSHLRTYKYLLFKNINEKDFLDKQGNYYTMAGDLALMFPMAEMSGGKIGFIDDILYVYNRATNLNDDKVNVKLQLSSATNIKRKPKYSPIV